MFYTNKQDSSSSDSSSTYTLESASQKPAHTPNYNPAEWSVLMDADNLDTAYDDVINRYALQVTEKLAKKQDREPRQQNC